ncbi:hypothetical protein AD947_07875 [Acetobacter tropicalis]|uniref:Uncharacterized protein n=1 Tax=Acetobacter tropicalis TaxID=104102 RepID=A0A149TXP7_9PROT|nr:hypothetical protein AD947_07875 [Acetobacter tropicalis]
MLHAEIFLSEPCGKGHSMVAGFLWHSLVFCPFVNYSLLVLPPYGALITAARYDALSCLW